MGSGCSSSRRVSDIHRRLSSPQISAYMPSVSEMGPRSPNNSGSMIMPPASATILPNGLTLKDAHLLRKMWPSSSCEQTYELGLEMFQLVFRLEPDTKQFFPCLHGFNPDEDGLELWNIGEFQNHIIRFVSMLTLCVRHCDQPDHLDNRLIELGRRHRQYAPHVDTKYFRVFEKAIAMVMRRRAEQQGIEEKEDVDSGYSGGVINGNASAQGAWAPWHPSSPVDKMQDICVFRNPKEQVRATIAWTSLAAYIVREIIMGFESASNRDGAKQNGHVS